MTEICFDYCEEGIEQVSIYAFAMDSQLVFAFLKVFWPLNWDDFPNWYDQKWRLMNMSYREWGLSAQKRISTTKVWLCSDSSIAY